MQIEKNIPIPTSYTFPFEQMEVGDSFVVPRELIKSLWPSMARHTKQRGHKFKSKRTGKDGERRCWRIE